MENYSKVIVSGVVTNTELNSDIIDIIRPVAEITVYDTKNKEWINNIYLIFSDNASARRFKGFNVGMILLISGELVYHSGIGYAVYVEEYTILERNKDKQSVGTQKILYFDNIGVQNNIFIKGKVVFRNEQKSIISISHKIIGDIRGELDKESIQPVKVLNKPKNSSNNVIFLGRFTKHLLEGEVFEVV